MPANRQGSRVYGHSFEAADKLQGALSLRCTSNNSAKDGVLEVQVVSALEKDEELQQQHKMMAYPPKPPLPPSLYTALSANTSNTHPMPRGLWCHLSGMVSAAQTDRHCTNCLHRDRAGNNQVPDLKHMHRVKILSPMLESARDRCVMRYLRAIGGRS